MGRYYSAEIDAVQDALFNQAIRAGRAYMADRYITDGGALRPKGQQRKTHDALVFDTWVKAVWISNGGRKTPSHWRSQILEAVRDEPINGV